VGFTEQPGVKRIVGLFSMVLGYSRLIWARFVIHQDLRSVLRCHFAALETIGGAPRENFYDRMTTAVIAKVRTACWTRRPGSLERPFRYIREVRLIARDRASDPRRQGPFQGLRPFGFVLPNQNG
jgi:hypothetical protein